MNYTPYIILVSINSLACFVCWTVIRLKDIRKQLVLVDVGQRAQKWKLNRIIQKMPGTKPDISRTPQIGNACQLRVANGTPILVMPNGDILPNQMDLSLDQPFSGGRKHLVKATVSMFVNVEDSQWLPSKEEVES